MRVEDEKGNNVTKAIIDLFEMKITSEEFSEIIKNNKK